jgi:ribonuclease E
VKDWSDLWIAVAAGCWLGAAQPGDVLEIVSNDRAFDAVGDAAAARGVIYHRLLHKRGAAAAAAAATQEDEPPRRRRSRGGRRRRGRGTGTASSASSASASPPPAPTPTRTEAAPPAPSPRRGSPRPALRAPTHPPAHEIEPHGATRDQIVSVIGRLSGGDTSRWINLDVLEKALKTDGFARPPGSPRLVTRLRMLRDIEVDSHGRARLSPGAAAAAPTPPPAVEAEAAAEGDEAKAAPAKRRRRRRKPTGNSDAGDAPSVETAAPAAAAYVDPPVE